VEKAMSLIGMLLSVVSLFIGCSASKPTTYAEQIIAINKEISKNPNNAKDFVERGQIHFKTRKWHLALQDFDIALSMDQKNVRTLFLRGKCYYEIKQYPDAIADFSKVIELSHQPGASPPGWSGIEDMAKYHEMRSKAYEKMMNYQKAIDDLSTAINLNAKITHPDYHEYDLERFDRRSNLYEKIGNQQLAESDRKEYVKLYNRRYANSPQPSSYSVVPSGVIPHYYGPVNRNGQWYYDEIPPP
jgi:tetratricopeptide (TPR) repeat protein